MHFFAVFSAQNFKKLEILIFYFKLIVANLKAFLGSKLF